MDRALILWFLLVVAYATGFLHGRRRPAPQPQYRGSPLADAARLLAATERHRQRELMTVDIGGYVARGRVPAAYVRSAALDPAA